MRRLAFTLAALAMTAANGGCGGSGGPPPAAPDAQQRLALNDVGELLRMYQVRTKKAPKAQKDVESMEMAAPTGMNAIRDKKVVVQWGATLPDLGEEPSSTNSDQVLAYEAKAPVEGGLVLTLDRQVKSLTADEFKAAPKAGK